MKELVKISSLRPFINAAGLDDTEEVIRKRISSKISISADEEKTCVANISTPDCDSDCDSIMAVGADLKRFMLNPVVLWSHDYSSKPIAKVVGLSVSEEGLVAKMKFADTEDANEVWSLVKDGFIKTCSIGFIIKERFIKGTEEFNSYVKENKIKVKENVQRIITKFELIENSFVAIPANPMALVQAISEKSITLSDKTLKEFDLPKVVVVEKVEAKEILPESIVLNKEEGIGEVKLFETEVKEVVPVEVKPEIRTIKVLRHGGADINKLVELRKLVKLGKVI
jgi:HK97 family phage prohead protease